MAIPRGRIALSYPLSYMSIFGSADSSELFYMGFGALIGMLCAKNPYT